MKKTAIFLIMIITTLCGNAQTFSQWSSQEIEKANTAKNTNLSEQEKLVFLYCNLARLDGEKFAKTYAKNKLSGSSSYIVSLKKDLENTKNLPMLYPDQNLCYTAAYHANDMGKTGGVGHSSTDGKSFSQRVRSYYNGGYIGENCSYGYSDAIDIVMQLLIDENTPSLGHRKNILRPDFKAMGVSIKPHKGYRFNCVQDFGDKIENPM